MEVTRPGPKSRCPGEPVSDAQSHPQHASETGDLEKENMPEQGVGNQVRSSFIVPGPGQRWAAHRERVPHYFFHGAHSPFQNERSEGCLHTTASQACEY